MLNVENKVEDVTQAILTMAKGSTKSEEVNELTKQIISEAVAEEYNRIGINADPDSLYELSDKVNLLARKKKKMPTIGSWYKRIVKKAQENENSDYRIHYSYLVKEMKQYVRE